MFKRIYQIFRGRPHKVEGLSAIEEGHSKAMILGDPYNGGAQIVVARVDGDLHALDSLCPHAADGHFNEGPLIKGRFIWCPAHNYRFEPQTGKPVGAVCRKARRYRLKVEGDITTIWV
ncbi:MAG: nitrite reductase/ring-hydroxylating ferredoxin subunit [Planctomycetota bacterium]|jgi:nitrite reductase/ring-hydroxylating ferredoxin subunit